MHIAICDDEEYFRRTLSDELYLYAKNYGCTFIIHEFADGTELLSSSLDFDIIFMDYKMRDKNDIDTVSVLRKRRDDTDVIFVSSYKEMVFDSMRVKAFRFLVKPLDRVYLYEALNSLLQSRRNTATVLLRDAADERDVVLPEEALIYAQACNNRTEVVTTRGLCIFPGKIGVLEGKLRSDCFFRTNRSYIVNFNFVSSFSKGEVTLENGHRALLTGSKFKEFKSVYLDFIKRKSIGEYK